jgi:hypothetical protein
MSRFTKLTATLIALAGSSALAAGCAENESMMFILGVAEISGSDCVLTPSLEGPFVGLGVLDLALSDTYIAPLVVGNQITERGSRNQLRTETSRVRLEGAEVVLESAGGATIAEFSTLGSGFVNPSAGTEAVYGGFFTQLIPPGAALAEGQYVAVIKVFGTTLGGQEIESAELRFPIDICFGCLVTYPGEAEDVSNGPGDPFLCATNAAEAVGGEAALASVGCFAGQDSAVSCLACSSLYDVCRDPALNPYYGN